MKTVKKVLDVLEAFEKPRAELSISELVSLSQLNASTVYRICSDFAQRGYLERAENRGKYRLGLRFIKFYDSLSEISHLKEIALVFMQRLSQAINESVTISVCVGSEITDIACVISSHKLQLHSKEGETLPLYCTSSGKIFLSQMDPATLNRVLKIKGMLPRTRNTITDLNLMKKEMAIIKRDCIAFDDEEYELGIRSIATEIKGREGNVIAAFAVVGPSIRISLQRMKELTPILKTYSAEISRVLGYGGGSAIKS